MRQLKFHTHTVCTHTHTYRNKHSALMQMTTQLNNSTSIINSCLPERSSYKYLLEHPIVLLPAFGWRLGGLNWALSGIHQSPLSFFFLHFSLEVIDCRIRPPDQSTYGGISCGLISATAVQWATQWLRYCYSPIWNRPNGAGQGLMIRGDGIE